MAERSIDHGLREGTALRIDADAHPEALRRPCGSFVTLRRNGELRGCIGDLEGRRPLVVGVAEHAFAAAFRDPRFPPLGPDERGDLTLEISVLSPLDLLDVASEEELLDAVRPGTDGLVLRDGALGGTFLPAVWEGLPEPGRFLAELRRKAGMPQGHGSPTLEVWRYTTAASFTREPRGA